MRDNPQLQHDDLPIWLALKYKFERLYVATTPCRSFAICPRDQDDPHDDAHPEEENSAKSEQGSSTLGNQEQVDDFDFCTDSYATDDDEISYEKVSLKLVDEMSHIVDEAKLRKVIDEILRHRCTSRDEHQYHIDQMQNFLKNDIVWESMKDIIVTSHPHMLIPVVQSCQRDPKAPALSLELGHEHKFITEIVARRANGSIVSIAELDYKNLNKNYIEDMYLLIVNHKVDNYDEKEYMISILVWKAINRRLEYNNGQYADLPQTEAVKAELVKLSLAENLINKTSMLKTWLWKKYVGYPRFISCVLERLSNTEYAQDTTLSVVNHQASVPLTPSLEKVRKKKKTRTVTKPTPTSQGPEASRVPFKANVRIPNIQREIKKPDVKGFPSTSPKDGTRKLNLLPEGTTINPKDSKGHIQLADTRLQFTSDEGIRSSNPLHEGKPTDAKEPEGNVQPTSMGSPATHPAKGISKSQPLPEWTLTDPKDSGSNIQLTNRGLPFTTGPNQSGADTKNQKKKRSSKKKSFRRKNLRKKKKIWNWTLGKKSDAGQIILLWTFGENDLTIKNEPKLTFSYEEADPLNPPPPAFDSESEDVVKVEDMIEPEDETVPNSVHVGARS
uniref:Uncharacterized protein n=1 Tax=Tanacetum cinerariifolium TaxID=118510 RepID=A0A6L2N9D9_TANCI|nr:hypothetical protein [Tanacetum cinerariifolium]